MDNATIFTLTIMVLCYAVISALVKRWYVAPALIFVLCGWPWARSASARSRWAMK